MAERKLWEKVKEMKKWKWKVYFCNDKYNQIVFHENSKTTMIKIQLNLVILENTVIIFHSEESKLSLDRKYPIAKSQIVQKFLLFGNIKS